MPSASAVPSVTPSYQPSMSSVPSLVPSDIPSFSINPSAEPSYVPSGSSNPSDVPSEFPSLSANPSFGGSASPSISSFPSAEPSLVPTGSTSPSEVPTETLLTSEEPSEIVRFSRFSGRTAHGSTRDGNIAETAFSATCNHGYYGVDNVEILERHDESIKFKLFQPFDSGLERYAVWFHNVESESDSKCFYRDSVSVGDIAITPFEAKCEKGVATISIYGGEAGDTEFHQMGLDTSLIPQARCQADVDVQEYNPNKRCYWEFKIDCTSDERRKLHMKLEGEKSKELSSCEENSKVTDLTDVQLNESCPTPVESPIKIVSQDDDLVTFTVSQVWKGCGTTGGTLEWLATDFDKDDGKLTCVGQNTVPCGLSSTFTSECTDGIAVIDVFASDMDVFKEPATIAVPPACGSPSGEHNTCHYRYLVKCSPSLCKGQQPVHRPSLKQKFLRAWLG